MKRLVVASAAVLVACSGSSGSDGGGGSGGVDAPCGDLGTVVVDGTLGGKAIHETSPLGGFAWVNFGKPSKFDGSWGTGSMHLEWASTIASGQVTDLQAGTLTLTSAPEARTVTTGRLVYDSPYQATESTLRSSLTFEQGTVTVCIRKKG